MTSAKKIAVIGAGIAGLSCAQRLQASGFNVTVFEKSRGAAGRMSTKRGENEDGSAWQCDTGAQYFTARHPRFFAEVQRWINAGVAAEWAPELQVFGTLPDSLEVGASTSKPQRFVGTPRMTAPARLLADTLNLRSQTTIQTLQKNEGQWRLHSAEHEWLADTFDAVVVAVPAPQAQPLLLPIHADLAELASTAPMRGSWALMLRYNEAMKLPFQAAFVNADPLRWVAEDSHKPGRNGQSCWLLHASAEWSDAHIEATSEQVGPLLISAFRSLGGREPDAWSAHRWRYADTAEPLNLGAVWDAQAGLGLCGDWLNGGKVEGAWLSGQLVADKILAAT